jgi:hypothetical protein
MVLAPGSLFRAAPGLGNKLRWRLYFRDTRRQMVCSRRSAGGTHHGNVVAFDIDNFRLRRDLAPRCFQLKQTCKPLCLRRINQDAAMILLGDIVELYIKKPIHECYMIGRTVIEIDHERVFCGKLRVGLSPRIFAMTVLRTTIALRMAFRHSAWKE